MRGPTQKQTSASPPPEVLRQTFGFVFATCSRRLYERTDAALAGISMSVRIYPILLLIAEHGPLTQTELVKLAAKDKNRIVEDVDALEQMEAVRREQDPIDRRAHAVVITKQGKRLLLQARSIVAGCEAEFLAIFSATELQQFKELLSRLFDSAHEAKASARTAS